MNKKEKQKLEKALSSALTDVFNTLEAEMDKEESNKKSRCKK